MDPTKPKAKIKPQTLANIPIRTSTILVNDPVALVNDPVAQSGGPVTQIPELGTSTSDNSPIGSINKRR